MYSYSERPKTLAERKFKDNVLPEIKSRRLSEIIVQQSAVSLKSNKEDIGKTFKVLVEGVSKKSEGYLSGRTDQNKVVVFPRKDFKEGDFVDVVIEDCTSATLLGVSKL